MTSSSISCGCARWHGRSRRTPTPTPSLAAYAPSVWTRRHGSTSSVAGGSRRSGSPPASIVDGTDDLPFRTGIGAGCNMVLRTDVCARASAGSTRRSTRVAAAGRRRPRHGDPHADGRARSSTNRRPSCSTIIAPTGTSLRYQYYSWGKGWGAVLAKWYAQPGAPPSHPPCVRGVTRDVLRPTLLVGPTTHRTAIGGRTPPSWPAGSWPAACGSYGRSRRRMQQRRRDVVGSRRVHRAIAGAGDDVLTRLSERATRLRRRSAGAAVRRLPRGPGGLDVLLYHRVATPLAGSVGPGRDS